MARISTEEWLVYIARMRALSDLAAQKMQAFAAHFGFGDRDALIDYAYGLATKYGEGSAALAAEMYDATAQLQKALVPPAEPADTADMETVARVVVGSSKTENPEIVGSAVGRLVKQAGADTTLQNALRDGAQFAWVPQDETCAFCITLASRGWQKASKNAIKNGHAEHIHANCDCQYAIRFDDTSTVEGYDPSALLARYNAAEGKTPREKINALRREFYAENKAEISKQKRDAYEKRQELNSSEAEETRV